MRKPTICICENKSADQLRSNCEADQRLCFRYMDSTILYFLNPKFPVSSHLLCLCSLICVRPSRKPHCWFSDEAAQFFKSLAILSGAVQANLYRIPKTGIPTTQLNGRSHDSMPSLLIEHLGLLENLTLLKLSHVMEKPTFRICKNKDTDLRLCFHYMDSTILLFPKSKIQPLTIFSEYTVWFVSDLFGNHIVGFLISFLNIYGHVEMVAVRGQLRFIGKY